VTDELKREIVRVAESLHGWCTATKAIILCEELEQMDAKLGVEIGVFAGRSLIPMAMMMAAMRGGGIIVGIDPWTAAAATEGYNAENAKWWGETVDLEAIYRAFMAAVEAEKVVGQVHVIREKSDDVTPPESIDLLHVDGQHTLQALRDVDRFARNVRRGGVCCMDDLNWTNDGRPEVLQAAARLKELGFVEKFPIGTGAMFVRAKLLNPPPLSAAR
jgi:hypothetical protein